LNPFLPLWLFFGPLLTLPAWLVIAEYFIVNLLNGLGSVGARGGGVAFFAHLGGLSPGSSCAGSSGWAGRRAATTIGGPRAAAPSRNRRSGSAPCRALDRVDLGIGDAQC
jgi:hypothetical protein